MSLLARLRARTARTFARSAVHNDIDAARQVLCADCEIPAALTRTYAIAQQARSSARVSYPAALECEAVPGGLRLAHEGHVVYATDCFGGLDLAAKGDDFIGVIECRAA